jgi:hypothetical protein
MRAVRQLSTVAMLCLATVAVADDEKCFDFSMKVERPLRPAPPLNRSLATLEFGSLENPSREFGSGRGLVPKPLEQVYEWLLDHTNWKDMKKTRLSVKEFNRPGYLAFHRVDVVVRVWAFIQIGWVEEWAYALIAGPPRTPNHVVVSYQKTSGTPHLPRLCGSVELRREGTGTDVYFYEEARADRYKARDMVRMQRGNLEVLGATVPPDPTAE